MNQKALENWLNERPRWLKYATSLLFSKNTLTDVDIVDIAQNCMNELNGLSSSNNPDAPIDITALISSKAIDNLKLKTITEIKNVNALSPTHPLDFSKENLTVVYGTNGSGKSSYVRLLKNVCSARTKEKLLGNIYSSTTELPQATFTYSLNGIDKTASWQDGVSCPDLTAIDIFDSSFSGVFIKNATTVTYEPPILAFFSRLIESCEKIAGYFQSEISKISNSIIPHFSTNLIDTEVNHWLSSISSKTTASDVDKHSFLSDTEKVNRVGYAKRLAEQNPADRAKQIRQTQRYAKELMETIKTIGYQFSKNSIDNIFALNDDVKKKQGVTTLVSQSLKENSELEGVGTNIWKTLWQAAKDYAEQYAYPNIKYPNISEGARCVLCHQTLDEQAIVRFKSFDEYINGIAEKELNKAKQRLADVLDSMSEIPSDDILATTLKAANITDDKTIAVVKQLFSQFRIHYATVRSLQDLESLPQIKTDEALCLLQIISEDYEKEAMKYEEDSKSDNREEIQKALNEILAKQWVNENKAAVFEEIERLNKITALEEAKKTTNTKPLSIKKRGVIRGTYHN
jgi:energy-coupling factor transporter ATP-binding protein EcfA2